MEKGRPYPSCQKERHDLVSDKVSISSVICEGMKESVNFVRLGLFLEIFEWNP
jgi:hypothetical protein